MFTMRPNPAFSISGRHSRMQRKVPVRFTDSMDCHRASLVSLSGPLCAWPALFTNTVIGPIAERAAATAARTESTSETSATWQLRRTAVNSAATASRSGRERPSSETSAPAPASERAIAAPMPRPAPVTRACRPVRGPVMRFSDGPYGLRRALEIALELRLARQIGLRPALFVKFLFRRGAQGPGRIRQVRPRQRAEIRPARCNDGVHVIRLENIAHCDGWNADLVADLIDERRLPHAPVHRPLICHGLPCRYVEHVCAGLFERARNGEQILFREAAFGPVAGGNSRRQGTPSRPDGTHCREDLQRESQSRGDVAAVPILTPVRER